MFHHEMGVAGSGQVGRENELVNEELMQLIKR